MKNNNFSNKKQQEFGSEDEGWYEDVWTETRTVKYKLFTVVKVVVVLMVVAGLVYLSGIYQGTLFQRTSEQARPRQLSPVVSGEAKILPLSVVNVVDEAESGDIKNEIEIQELVNKASVIWDQARIDLELAGYTVLKIDKQQMSGALNNPRRLLAELPEEDKQGVVVFLVYSLHGINGIAFVGGRTIAVAEFTSVYDFRVLAHEVGHILGLPHVNGGTRLMSTDAGGPRITVEEAEEARQTLDEILK